jgi:hypothetical protein
MRGELRKIEKPNDIPLGLSMLHRLASLKQVDEAKMPQRLTVHIVQLCRSQDSGGPVDVFDCHAVRTGFGRRDAVTRFFDSRASDG